MRVDNSMTRHPCRILHCFSAWKKIAVMLSTPNQQKNRKSLNNLFSPALGVLAF